MNIYVWPTICGNTVIIRAENRASALEIVEKAYMKLSVTQIDACIEIPFEGEKGIVVEFLS